MCVQITCLDYLFGSERGVVVSKVCHVLIDVILDVPTLMRLWVSVTFD